MFGKGISKLLSVAKLPSGTGCAQATAVFNAVEDWGIVESIRAMCFDTTSSNTGQVTGACVLEEKFERELLSLACRHHVMELVIESVFQVCMGSSSCPEVPLFKHFQAHWAFIDPDKYDVGVDSLDVLNIIRDVHESVKAFAFRHLEEAQPRDDYRELLELTLIFMGAVPRRGVHFMSPGAMHHARWMSKVIYYFNVWMFLAQFKLTPREDKDLRDVCVFVVHIYISKHGILPQM